MVLTLWGSQDLLLLLRELGKEGMGGKRNGGHRNKREERKRGIYPFFFSLSVCVTASVFPFSFFPVFLSRMCCLYEHRFKLSRPIG
jgi:hypothetical protein